MGYFRIVMLLVAVVPEIDGRFSWNRLPVLSSDWPDRLEVYPFSLRSKFSPFETMGVVRQWLALRRSNGLLS